MDIFCVKIAEREQISFGESVTFQKPEFWCRIRREKVVLLSGSECAILMTQNFGFWKTNRKWKLCKDDDLIDGSFIPGSRFILVRKSQFFAIFGNRRKKTFWWIKFRRFRFLLLLNIFGLKKTSFWTFKEASNKNNFPLSSAREWFAPHIIQIEFSWVPIYSGKWRFQCDFEQWNVTS